MADYVGVYSDDFGSKTFVRLQVYLIVNSSRENTTVEFDRDYLPSVYLNNVQLFNPKSPNCPIDTRLRYAKLFTNSTDYLRVEIPFKPSSENYDRFFIETAFNPLIVTQGIEGERITPASTRQKSK